jgi:hypothetical protein
MAIPTTTAMKNATEAANPLSLSFPGANDDVLLVACGLCNVIDDPEVGNTTVTDVNAAVVATYVPCKSAQLPPFALQGG